MSIMSAPHAKKFGISRVSWLTYYVLMWTRYEHVKSAVKNSMFKLQQVLTYRSVACFFFAVFTARGKDICKGKYSFPISMMKQFNL